MHSTEEYIYWLRNIYVSEKTKDHLNSVKHYVRGLHRINEVFNLPGKGVFDARCNLEEIRQRIQNSEYFHTSLPIHLAAYTKYREYLKGQNLDSKPQILRQPDTFKKQQVEIAAIETVIRYYQEIDYSVVSKEKDNIGWDLEASNGKVTLLLEVKGLSGNITCVELTPNEYQNAKIKCDQYKLCIVTHALSNPILEIFSFDAGLSLWKNEMGQKLIIEERVAARFWK